MRVPDLHTAAKRHLIKISRIILDTIANVVI